MKFASDGGEPPGKPLRRRRNGSRSPTANGAGEVQPPHELTALGRPAAERETFPGRLFVVEGIDGSGKSTQVDLLYKWLLSEGYLVVFTEWNSSPVVKAITRRGKNLRLLSPLSFSLIHAADFASRVSAQILPALKAGAVVLADRYIYTAFARDAARGVSRPWLRRLYSFAVEPTLVFYFDVPPDEAVRRILTGRSSLKYYEAGMDLDFSPDPVESFGIFQRRVWEEYERLVGEFGMTRIDATETLVHQQQQVRDLVAPYLGGTVRLPNDGVSDALRQSGLQGRYLAQAGRRTGGQP